MSEASSATDLIFSASFLSTSGIHTRCCGGRIVSCGRAEFLLNAAASSSVSSRLQSRALSCRSLSRSSWVRGVCGVRPTASDLDDLGRELTGQHILEDGNPTDLGCTEVGNFLSRAFIWTLGPFRSLGWELYLGPPPESIPRQKS